MARSTLSSTATTTGSPPERDSAQDGSAVCIQHAHAPRVTDVWSWAVVLLVATRTRPFRHGHRAWLHSLSSGRGRSWRDAAERANDGRRAHNVSIDGLNQAIVGQSALLEVLRAECVERKDIVVPLACRGGARP
jgi:hypothetical protein